MKPLTRSSRFFLSFQETTHNSCFLFLLFATHSSLSFFPRNHAQLLFSVSHESCVFSPRRFPKMVRRCVRVSFHGVNLSVTATKKAAEVDRWIKNTIRNHYHHLHDLVIGLDIEWHPNLSNDFKHPNPVATLQLCVGRSCLIFQLLHRDYIPYSLFHFLACPFFTFVGVGVRDDAEKLFRDHGLIVWRMVDLRYLAEWVFDFSEFSRMGLKRMALEILGQVMEKPLEVTLSHWDTKDLTFRQIEYGSIDAFASFQIGFNLFTMAAYKLGLL